MPPVDPISPGPGTPPADPAPFNGVSLPAALFSHDPALESALIRISPTEISYFTEVSAAEVLRVCGGLARGAEARRRVLRDRYFDTSDGRLSKRGVSVRLRQYTVHSRPIVFEVIAISWAGVRALGPLKARTNQVLVQTFEENGPEDHAAMLAQYARAGFVRVAEVGKTRTGWDLHPVIEEVAGGILAAGMDHRGLGGARGEIRVHDLGLKLLVDELQDPVFPERTIIEIEYGLRHEAEAAEVAGRLHAALGGALREKERNKIAYLLAG